MLLFYNCRDKLFSGRLILQTGAMLLKIIFVTPNFLAPPVFLSPGIHQKGRGNAFPHQSFIVMVS